ncbi:hypothetical protein [Streptomyces sp. NPDC059575]|uniref:hypothetical protein n=1 Tax=Streptomyces sp. NPDC059575 TaxID=3346872 RepID=UPI0036839E01
MTQQVSPSGAAALQADSFDAQVVADSQSYTLGAMGRIMPAKKDQVVYAKE